MFVILNEPGRLPTRCTPSRKSAITALKLGAEVWTVDRKVFGCESSTVSALTAKDAARRAAAWETLKLYGDKIGIEWFR